jgi:hypothetical protein
MKAVIALAFAGAAVAIPAGWSDAPVDPVKSTTTTAEVTSTWEDQPIISTTTTTPVSEEHTWEDAEVSSTTVDPSTTWADYSISTTPVAESSTTTWVCPRRTRNQHIRKTILIDLLLQADYSVPVTETTTTLTAITTYCAKPTTFTDKGDAYTVTEATTLTLTHGPYTVTIPVYEETSTVCDEATSTWVCPLLYFCPLLAPTPKPPLI